MKKIDLLLQEYGESHQNQLNKAIHWICVPLIFLSIVGLVWSIPSGILSGLASQPVSDFLNWATVILSLVLVYYAILSIPMFVGMLLFSTACILLIYWVDQAFSSPLWLLSIVVFILAWIGQFYGHRVEGKKPSFLKDIQFLLVGPAWLMHFILKKIGIKY
ncbi:MAG: DUF962 domain-containing protein [Cyclobacteriaceae bacterium]|nr:DUF962 domain-containing protein [Cyclobacteriaceae bacterium]MCH8516620.1 DUF962 domain-containing protein [Cyclobacteriaceae bacterium]